MNSPLDQHDLVLVEQYAVKLVLTGLLDLVLQSQPYPETAAKKFSEISVRSAKHFRVHGAPPEKLEAIRDAMAERCENLVLNAMNPDRE